MFRFEERAHKRVSELHARDRSGYRDGPDAPVSNALRQMAQSDSGRLIVMEQDRLTGLITRSAIAHFIMVRSQLGFAAPDRMKPWRP